MYSYTATTHTGKNGDCTTLLSVEWDTKRDCAMAAKLRFDMCYAEFKTLQNTGTVEIVKPFYGVGKARKIVIAIQCKDLDPVEPSRE